ncbi:MAG: serine hydrolase [Eubacterium sp.]|nr:serine hydrolase [Eubacterium sp.]
MSKRQKEDDLLWLQVLHKKEQLRAKKRRRRFLQRTLAIVLILTALFAGVFFTVQKAAKDGKQNPGAGKAAAGTDTGQLTVADEPGTQQTSKDGTETGTDAQQPEDTGAQSGTSDAGADETDAGSGTSDPDDAQTYSQVDGYQYLEKTRTLGGGISSNYAVLLDADNQTVLAGKDETERIVPASMTKVLTLLTAVEQLGDTPNLDDKFKITVEITDYCYVNECSVAGFGINEKVTVKDLLYGLILPSGADAALGLAEYVAGSEKAFVKLMNEKLEELGLSETAHFTNCIGIYDKDHYCTLFDLAVIMQAALENSLCREVLSAHTYTTSKTKQNPEGMVLSNWFLRRIEDKDTGGEVLCAKTGYVSEAGSCAVSYGVDTKDRQYICVTADAQGSWKCIYDHVKLYKRFSNRK